MTEKLNARHLEIFQFIESFLKANGFSPTLQEIRNEVGIPNANCGRNHLLALERKGFFK